MPDSINAGQQKRISDDIKAGYANYLMVMAFVKSLGQGAATTVYPVVSKN
jgi:hypothetical protein